MESKLVSSVFACIWVNNSIKTIFLIRKDVYLSNWDQLNLERQVLPCQPMVRIYGKLYISDAQDYPLCTILKRYCASLYQTVWQLFNRKFNDEVVPRFAIRLFRFQSYCDRLSNIQSFVIWSFCSFTDGWIPSWLFGERQISWQCLLAPMYGHLWTC